MRYYIKEVLDKKTDLEIEKQTEKAMKTYEECRKRRSCSFEGLKVLFAMWRELDDYRSNVRNIIPF